MLCVAIINIDDEAGLKKTLGKKKLKECGLPIGVLNEYMLICPSGHIMIRQAWEDKAFQEFFSNNKGESKV